MNQEQINPKFKDPILTESVHKVDANSSKKPIHIDKWSASVTLVGQKIRLEPASLLHADSIVKNVLFKGSWHEEHWPLGTADDVRKMLEKRAIADREEKIGNCFVMLEDTTGDVVGVSNLMNFNRRHNYLEIGGTCIGKRWQKTFVNTESKLLMLGYAFEEIGCQRVEFNG